MVVSPEGGNTIVDKSCEFIHVTCVAWWKGFPIIYKFHILLSTGLWTRPYVSGWDQFMILPNECCLTKEACLRFPFC
jgi:hypothetical protein